jgi:hypothetical protein
MGAKLLERLRLPDGQPYSKAMLLTFAALVVAFSGDTFRYTIGWTGYGAIVGLLVALSVVLLVRRKPQLRLRHLPLMLLLFTAWCLVSLIWSGYRLETLAGSAVQLATAFVALVTAVSLTRRDALARLRLARLRTLRRHRDAGGRAAADLPPARRAPVAARHRSRA